MGSPDLRNIINLYREKVILTILLLIFSGNAYAQLEFDKGKVIHNPNYDSRFISYGFLLGIHTSNFKMEYSDAFATPDSEISQLYNLEDFHSILPQWTTGFNLGFIVNFKMADLLDVRITPQVTFYEYHLEYRYLVNSTTTVLSEERIIESTLVEFPLLAKFKSERRGNTRAYMVGGIKPGLEVSGKNRQESDDVSLDVRQANLTLELGLGLDVYFPLFKFSPEIRYSRGLTNMHLPLENQYSVSIRELNTNTITLYLLFQ